MTHPIAIVGGGSAGVMAALRCALNNMPFLLLPGAPADKKRSRALWVRKIENIPGHFGYSRGIEEPNAEVLRWIGESPFAGCMDLRRNTGAARITREADGSFLILDSKGESHRAQHVLLCTGVMDVQPLVGGDIAPVYPFANAQLIDYCLRCDGHHVKDRATAVIGHTTAAAWVAIMLHERYAPPAMHLLAHGAPFELDADVSELLDMYGIRRHTGEIIAFLGDVKLPTFEGVQLADGNSVPLGMAFVSLGMRIHNDFARALGAELDPRGFVRADAAGLTSVPGLYVAGDLMAGTKKQVYTAWDTAVNAADAVNQKWRALRRAEALANYRAR